MIVIILKATGFINQQVKRDSSSVWNIKLNSGTLCVVHHFCGTWDIELWEIWNRRRKMVETALGVYRNGHLVCV
jgi:hypothetical protein